MADTTTDWQAEALRLRATTSMQPVDIGEAVGKHPATIRKLFARTPETDYGANIPGQTTVDEQIAASPGEPDQPEDDPERHVDPLDQFRAEAGEAVGPMPPVPEEDSEPVVETRVRGTRQLALDYGDDVDIPTGGTLVIRSEKLASGFFARGDVITGTFTARIVSVGDSEKFDKDCEDFRAKPQAHVALITEFTVGGDQ